MPSATQPNSLFQVKELSLEFRKDRLMCAEMVFSEAGPIDPETLVLNDINRLLQALYDHSIIVIRK
jgi:hypothetical protein